ncbi:MAG TPA: SIR2 family protein [Chthoniobacterales bacterium]|nr:SIR2 family protein [Chthoniobacterales bacterium]
MPHDTWVAVAQLASQLKDQAVMPLLGAGASIPCGSPRSTDLAEMLYQSVAPLSNPPSDVSSARSDLGRMADAVALVRSPTAAVEALEFRNAVLWPSPAEAFQRHDTQPHPCAYRVLARMAKERFLVEGVTFDYDCHFEGGLLKEGFFPNSRRTHHHRWPELFTVIANARLHASVLRRGEFVLNKVHGCAETWRRDSSVDADAASEGIVLRWSQLLDWRQDAWSRDLVRDRARRHILLLVGFSGLDPVIHATLQAVMREVAPPGAIRGASRIRAVDTDTEKLTLRMLVAAGAGDEPDDVRTVAVGWGVPPALATVLGALHSELLALRITDGAKVHKLSPSLPAQREDRARRLLISAPAMLRWTWSVMAGARGEAGLTGLGERLDDYYVPLTSELARTLLAFAIRDDVASRFAVPAEAAAYTADGSFVAVPGVGKAFMPIGLYPHELESLTSGYAGLANLPYVLKRPPGLDRFVVARDGSGVLRAFSLETGHEDPAAL